MVRQGEVLHSYCSICRGVLPFSPCSARGGTRRCERCGTLFRLVDPGAPARNKALRYLVCGAVAGCVLALMAARAAALSGSAAPPPGWLALASAVLLGAFVIACLARALSLWDRSGRYERLEPYEWEEIERHLYRGMIRSDVEMELYRRGWRPGKVRAVFDSLRPVEGGAGGSDRELTPSGRTAPAPAPPAGRRTS